MRYLPILLLLGCASPAGSEFGVGVGREFRDGGFSMADNDLLDGKHSTDLSSDTLFEYKERDVDSLNFWYVWKFGPSSKPELFSPPLQELPASPPVPGPVKDVVESKVVRILGMEIPVGTPVNLILALAVLIGAGSLFGFQRGKKKLDQRKAKRAAA